MENMKATLLRLTGAKSIRAIATQAGVEPSTMNRQANGTTSLTVETLVSICRAYSIDFSDAFVSVGFITEEEAGELGRSHSLAEYTDLELAHEIVRRLEAAEATAPLTEPISSANVSGMTDDELSNLDLSQGDYELASTTDRTGIKDQTHPDYEGESQDPED